MSTLSQCKVAGIVKNEISQISIKLSLTAKDVSCINKNKTNKTQMQKKKAPKNESNDSNNQSIS